LENRRDHQSNMIEVEGNISNQPIAIFIDLGSIIVTLPPNLVEQFHLKRSNHEKSWLVQLAIGTKSKINEIFKGCPLDMNGVSTIADLNIIPLGSYDVLIGMDLLDVHHVVLDFHHKTIDVAHAGEYQILFPHLTFIGKKIFSTQNL
jgi:hypothetical protein